MAPLRVGRRCRGVSLVPVVLGSLLLACDGNVGPTQPTGSPPGPTSTERSSGPIAFVSNRDGSDHIYLANEDGSAVTRLVEGSSPAWASDGGRLAFRQRFEIHVVNVGGTSLRRVIGGLSPAWSPDGATLVFENHDGSDSDIDLVDADGSNRRPLFSSGGYGAFDPVWSPDGQRVLFSVGTYIDFDTGLWTMNADGTDAHQVGGLHDGWQPAWSPDGSQIAFVTPAGIEVARSDGAGRRLLVPGPARDPDWTPDGRLIFTRSTTPVADLGAPARIFITDGMVERQLIPDVEAPFVAGYADSQPVWLR